MISPLREDLMGVGCCKESDPAVGRTGELSQWSVPMAAIGILLMFTAVPLAVAGERGIGITGDTSPFKGYSGIQVQPEAKRVVYYHEQTIAVVEVGPKRELFNCELIEVYKPVELKTELKRLSTFSKTYRLMFEEMMELMTLCNQLDSPSSPSGSGGGGGRSLMNNNPLTLIRGILPGTKWCGAGDLASNYFDLGVEANLDKCCRAHDLCPVKVRAYTSRYNLTNNSLYTKSHCSCDSMLQQCLKKTRNPLADIMGNIYFNLLKVPCVRQGKDRSVFQASEQYDVL